MSARAALLELVQRDGFITPATVVEEATDSRSPLHRYFTWDDTAAAERYRLIEARQLCQRYKITVETANETTVSLRQFTSVPFEDGPGYITTESALRGKDTREFVLQQAMRDVAALRQKYQTLIDFDEVLRASIGKSTKRKAAS